MFAIDGSVPAKKAALEGRQGEMGMLLTSAKIGEGQKDNRIYGSHFNWGSTGIAALGNGDFYISHDGAIYEKNLYHTNLKLYTFDPTNPQWFSLKEE